MDAITQFDMNILHAIHENLSGGFMDFIMPIITMFGEYGLFWIAISVVLIIIKKTRRCGVTACGAILTSFIIGNILLKHIFARSRPCWLEPDYLTMLVAVPKDFSFPSGHSMISFTVATVLFLYNKKIGIPALVLAALIAFSRLYLFVHFPTDVLVGTLMGIGFGILAYFVVKKIADNIRRKKVSS